MKVENALYPAAEQIEALRNDPSLKPVVMLNLLKFRTRAQYPDGRKTDLTGAQAYGLYAEAMRKMLEKINLDEEQKVLREDLHTTTSEARPSSVRRPSE